MKKWLTSMTAFCALVATIVTAMSYFARQSDVEVLASNVQSNRDQLNYQSALRTYEFLVKQSRKYPNDKDLKYRLHEASKRVKHYECKLFKNCG